MNAPDPRSRDEDRWRSWAADGVRHAILLRVLPIQRHDVLGPLSVLRMGLAVLKRRAGDVTPNLEDIQRRIGEADVQVAEAVRRVAALRQWDAVSARPRPWPELADEALRLVQTSASMAGHRIEPLDPSELAGEAALVLDETEAARVPYLLLGLLMHLQDSATEPQRWTPSLLSDGLSLRLQPMSADGAAPALAPSSAGVDRPIDEAAMALLLDGSGWRLSRRQDAAHAELRLQRAG